MKYENIVCRINCEPGWFGNPFCQIDKETDLFEVANEFVLRITSSYNFEIRLAEAEKYLLASMAAYLFWEAPPDEQNMFMVYMLVKAGMLSESYIESNMESDLDRLCNMLHEKNSDHIALQYYAKYKNLAGERQQKVIANTLKHIPQYCVDLNSNFLDFLVNQNATSDAKSLQKVAKAFVSMIDDYDKSDADKIKEEYSNLQAEEYLFIALIYTAYFDPQTSNFRQNPKIITISNFMTFALEKGIDDISRLVAIENKRAKNQSDNRNVNPAISYYKRYTDTFYKRYTDTLSRYPAKIDRKPFRMLPLIRDFFREFSDDELESDKKTNNDILNNNEKIGIVKWFEKEKGYGYIESDDGLDVFVHFTAINMDTYRPLKEGERVKFEIVSGDKGVQASNVMIIEDKSDAIINKPSSLKNNFNNEAKEIEIVELFNDDGMSITFEILETIEYKNISYLLLTPYVENTREGSYCDVPSDVFIMCEAKNDTGEKILETVEDENIINKVFQIFKERRAEIFDFVE